MLKNKVHLNQCNNDAYYNYWINSVIIDINNNSKCEMDGKEMEYGHDIDCNKNMI